MMRMYNYVNDGCSTCSLYIRQIQRLSASIVCIVNSDRDCVFANNQLFSNRHKHSGACPVTGGNWLPPGHCGTRNTYLDFTPSANSPSTQLFIGQFTQCRGII